MAPEYQPSNNEVKTKGPVESKRAGRKESEKIQFRKKGREREIWEWEEKKRHKNKAQRMEVDIKNINIGLSHREGRGREWSNLLGVGSCVDLYFVNYSTADL